MNEKIGLYQCIKVSQKQFLKKTRTHWFRERFFKGVMVYTAESITFAFCNVILDLGNISFDKSMQWMNKI